MNIVKKLKSIFKKKVAPAEIKLPEPVWTLINDQKSLFNYLNDLIEIISGYKIKGYQCQEGGMPPHCLAELKISFRGENDRFRRENISYIGKIIEQRFDQFLSKFYKEYGWLLGRIHWWIKIDLIQEYDSNGYDPGERYFLIKYLTDYREIILMSASMPRLVEMDKSPLEGKTQYMNFNLNKFNVIRDQIYIG